LGTSPSSLRSWEQMGLIRPVRSQGHFRLYTQQVLDAAKRILHLRRKKGLNLAGIAHFLESESRAGAVPAPILVPSRKISSTLLRLRKKNSLTLADVSRKTWISVSFISALERGETNPSIATLQKLATLYGTNVRSFFGGQGVSRPFTRARDRKVLQPQPGVRIEELAVGDTMMDPSLYRIAPGRSSGGSYRHEGEEFVYVLQGRLEMWLDEVDRYILERGDCLYFKSTQAHLWRNASTRETVLLWVNTPPTF